MSAPLDEGRLPTAADFQAWRDAYEAIAPDPTHFDEFAARNSAMVHEFAGWTDELRSLQAHLDVRVPDLDAGSAKAAELGAELLRKNKNWYTLADPAGHPFDLCLFPAKQETTLMGVMLDCPDARELSTFYAELLGKPVTYESEGVAMIGDDGAQP